MKRKLIIRYILLGVLLLLVWMTQSIPALGNLYSQTVYPVISRVLSFFSNLFPFAIGDLFYFREHHGSHRLSFLCPYPQETAVEEDSAA